MTLLSDIVSALAATGASPEQISAVVAVYEKERIAKDEARRSKVRDRVRRHRERNACNADVTLQNVTECYAPPSSPPNTPTPPNTPPIIPPFSGAVEPAPTQPAKPKAKPEAGPEGFAEFWAAYPRRDGANPRAPAEVSYAKALKGGARPEEILAGVRGYAAEVNRKGSAGTEFVAQAVTWLNQRRWRDYLAKPQAGSGRRRAEDIPDEYWRDEVAHWDRSRGGWSLNHVSEPPDSPRTRVPPHILAEFGLSRAA